MIRRRVRHVVSALLALTLAACVTPPWTQIDKETRACSNAVFKITLPVGWMRANYLNDVYYVKRDKSVVPLRVDRITFTRDGFALEDMDFIRFDAKDGFPNLQRPYTSNMLPSEAADLMVSDLKKAGLDALNVQSNEPATIAGKAGFKLHISYKNARGLRIERTIYGFGYKSSFYVMSFEAPSLHYFPAHRGTFNEVVQSFRLIG
ncbi:MAG: hypothetical protein ACJ8NR_02825 [Sulfurifustis sp.]